jgi:WD40-like Beta Propeller Repeat
MTAHRTNHGVTFLALAFLALALPCLQTPSTAAAAGCANEANRAEQGVVGLALPDCRAYELVSPGSTPLVSSSGDVSFGARAANAGNAMAYFSYYPFEGSPSSGWFFRARRGAAGWSLEAMSPQALPGAAPKIICEATELNYSEDLLASNLRIGREIKQEYPGSSFCSQPQEEIVPGEPRGFANLLRQASPGAPYELVNLTPAGASPANAQFQDASDDLSHIAFGEEAELTPEAPLGYNLYLWVGGTVRLVSFLPNGTPVRGDLVGATQHVTEGQASGGNFNGIAPITNAVSADGERVFFYAGGSLYLRKNAGQPPTAAGPCSVTEPERACTVQVDVSHGAGNSGGGVFQYASTDGRRVFFTDESQLTFPSSAAAGKPALYEYNVETRALADRTSGITGADVRGFSGAAKDGSRLYFVAKSALTGTQENAQGEVAQSGQPNLYLLEEGALTFIATLDPTADRSAWNELPPQQGGLGLTLSTRTSPDGRYFAFNSVRGLAGGSAGTRQIFLYDAVSGSLTCVSCLPGGGISSGPSALPSPIFSTEAEAPAYLPRGLTDKGQLFFTTTQALLPADTDGVADVYEYREGELHLISDGTAAGPSFFFDADEGAGNVFFATSDALVRSDTDNVLNLYDARVGGGFAEPPAPVPPCAAGEPCRSVGSGAPSTGTLTTPTQSGAGNVVPPKRCKHGKVRRKGHCVKKAKHHKHKHKKGARR